MTRILIIEDDALLADVLVQKLKNEGFETLLARDGEDGYTQMQTLKPDLILLDILLPKMNGYEILEKKIKDPALAPIPVIVVSNSGQPVEINRALALGVKDYLVKAQFDPEEVLVKVRALLGTEGNRGVDSGVAIEGLVNQKDNTSSLEGKKILWVEDDQFLNDIIARKLSTIKCVFFHASDGLEALKIVNAEIPDIVVLDILLPGMDGFEILHNIKSDPKTKNIPVILLSNLGRESDIEKGKGLGAALFMIKATVTPNDIVNKIQQVLSEAKK